RDSIGVAFPCQTTEYCNPNGSCDPCPSGKTPCSGACVTLGTDQHCRDCNACTGGTTCQGNPPACLCPDGSAPVNGQCSGTCSDPSLTYCPKSRIWPGGCVDLQTGAPAFGTDVNCGSCGTYCAYLVEGASG